MSLSQQRPQSPIDALRDHLARGVTGRLSAVDRRGRSLDVFLLQGEALAAHAPDDGPWLVRRLVNNGAITDRQGKAFARSVEQGRSAEELLLGHVPDSLFHTLLQARFRQNLLELLDCEGPAAFAPLDAVFVRNVQVGHDSGRLLTQLLELRERVSPLVGHAGPLNLRPGPSMPATQQQARLMDLCEPSIQLKDLLTLSPFEAGATLLMVVEMLENGALVSDEGIKLAQPPALAQRRSRERPPGMVVEELFSLDEPAARAPAAPQAAPVSLDLLNGEDLEPLPELEGADLQPVDSPPVRQGVSVVTGRGPATSSADDTWTPEDEADPAPTPVPSPAAAPAPAPEPDDGPEPEGGWVPRPSAGQSFFESSAPPDADDAAFFGVDDGSDPEDLGMFQDQDHVRGGGMGQFSLKRELLDVVDLREEALRRGRPLPEAPPPVQEAEEELLLEALDADDAQFTAEDKVVALSFGAPRLQDDEIEHKFEVCNGVLARIAAALDRNRGPGSGSGSVQLLLDGAPSVYAPLFGGLNALPDGRFSAEAATANLRRRPDSEWRTLLDRGTMDLIERGLSLAVEELPDAEVDKLLESIAGYQQRLRC